MEENSKHISMKLLAEDDRPREKLASLGRNALSNAELIAVLMGSGNRDETAVQLAQRMLSDHGNNISTLAKLSVSDLRKYRGVGLAKAISISAAFELGRRRKESTAEEKIKITSSRVAFDLLYPSLADLPHEEFRILLLNRANQVTKDIQLSKGGISGTVVDVRLICRAALENGASGVIMAHNHPSGQVIPSEQDKSITTKLKEALKMLEIALLDHVIIGDNKYYSFSDEGLL